MPCRVPKRRFSCGAPQHLTKNLIIYPNTFPREGVFACNEISIRDEFLHEFTKQNQ